MYKIVKRTGDIFLSLVSLILLSPLFLLLAVLIKLDSSGTVFFKQKRVGIGKSHFQIYKFRSMYTEAPANMPTHMLKNADAHITKMGKFLRRTSLDELPQIFNILRGDMAIIGPRPALWNQYDLIDERDKYNANDIRPGLTGWAQIHGRDELPIPLKAQLDGSYVDQMGLIMDLKIFFKTIAIAVTGDGFAG